MFYLIVYKLTEPWNKKVLGKNDHLSYKKFV